MSTIVIDPGHGGTTNIGGSDANHAAGPAGTLEKDLTLQLGVKVAEQLNNSGYTVRMTRNSDVNMSLKDRAGTSITYNADILVSIHFNGWPDPATQGTETWVYNPSSADAQLLATSLLQQLVNVTGYTNRGVKAAKFGVLNPAYLNIGTVATLCEISFLTDPNEELRLNSGTYLDDLASAVSRGITDYINNSSSMTPLPPVTDPSQPDDGDA